MYAVRCSVQRVQVYFVAEKRMQSKRLAIKRAHYVHTAHEAHEAVCFVLPIIIINNMQSKLDDEDNLERRSEPRV